MLTQSEIEALVPDFVDLSVNTVSDEHNTVELTAVHDNEIWKEDIVFRDDAPKNIEVKQVQSAIQSLIIRATE